LDYLKALYRTNLSTVLTLEKAQVADKMVGDKTTDDTRPN
jgi:hypothetical protein